MRVLQRLSRLLPTVLVRACAAPDRRDVPDDPLPAAEDRESPVVGKPQMAAAAIRDAAWKGYVPEGLIHTMHEMLNVESRSEHAKVSACEEAFREKLLLLGSELRAFVEQPMPEPPMPKVLGSKGTIIPFATGERRHG